MVGVLLLKRAYFQAFMVMTLIVLTWWMKSSLRGVYEPAGLSLPLEIAKVSVAWWFCRRPSFFVPWFPIIGWDSVGCQGYPFIQDLCAGMPESVPYLGRNAPGVPREDMRSETVVRTSRPIPMVRLSIHSSWWKNTKCHNQISVFSSERVWPNVCICRERKPDSRRFSIGLRLQPCVEIICSDVKLEMLDEK